MFSDKTESSQDTFVLEQLDIDAFDCETIRRYRNRLRYTRLGHVWSNINDAEFFYKLGCVGRSDEDGRLHPTAAGILMFGFEYEIVKEFPEYFLDYQEHDDASIRWTDRIISTSGEWSGNIFDFYYRVYNRLVQVIKTPFKLVGDTRIDDTPVHKAIREALANALTNTNYYGRRGLVIHRYPDRITIANPGSMRIRPDAAVIGGDSDPRNKTIMKLFNLIDIGERSGSGVPSIYAAWKAMKWPNPVLEERFNPDRTILSLTLSAIATDNVTGNVADKITGKVTGNVADNVTDNVADKVTGKVADNVTDNVADNVTGKVADNIADNLTDNVTGKVADNVTDNVADKVADNEGKVDHWREGVP
jgi:predicted HTH transcriptional regulator